MTCLLLSLVLPGLGHVHAGRAGRGVAIAGVEAAAMYGWLEAGLASFAGFCVGVLVWILGLAAVAWDAWRCARASRRPWRPAWRWLLAGPLLAMDLALGPVLDPDVLDPRGLGPLRPVRYRVGAVRGASMAPALREGDRIVLDARPPRLARGDVLLVKDPEDPGGLPWIKRCVALGGDRVEIRAGRLRVNGADAGACPWPPGTHPPPPEPFGPMTIPEGQVFCVGDNRGVSRDGRHTGPLPGERVLGRVRLLLPRASSGKPIE